MRVTAGDLIRSLLCLCDVFRVLINSLVFFRTSALGVFRFQMVSRIDRAFCPWELESKETFTQHIPYIIKKKKVSCRC